jgi:hypothetical protein
MIGDVADRCAVGQTGVLDFDPVNKRTAGREPFSRWRNAARHARNGEAEESNKYAEARHLPDG